MNSLLDGDTNIHIWNTGHIIIIIIIITSTTIIIIIIIIMLQNRFFKNENYLINSEKLTNTCLSPTEGESRALKSCIHTQTNTPLC